MKKQIKLFNNYDVPNRYTYTESNEDIEIEEEQLKTLEN